MPKVAARLTPVGKLIEETGLSLAHVLQKSGLSRNRLLYLRTVSKSVFTFEDAQALAPALRMSMDELSAALNRIKEQVQKRESSAE
jgi:hypothetical protein